MRSQSPEGIVWDVRERLADVGLAFAAGRDPNVSVLHRTAVPTCAFMAPAPPLAGKANLTLADVQPFPIATSKSSTLRRLLDNRATLDGVRPDVAYECNASTSLFSYVSRGNGVAFAAEISARSWLRRGDLVGVQRADRASFDRTIEIQVMKGRSLAAYVSDWIECMRAALDAGRDWPGAQAARASPPDLRPRLVQ